MPFHGSEDRELKTIGYVSVSQTMSPFTSAEARSPMAVARAWLAEFPVIGFPSHILSVSGFDFCFLSQYFAEFNRTIRRKEKEESILQIKLRISSRFNNRARHGKTCDDIYEE